MEVVTMPSEEQTPGAEPVTTLLLDISRVLVQWRADATMLVAPEDDVPALLRRPPDVPSAWRSPLPDNAVMAVEEAPPGDLDRPSWWVLYGNADPDVEVTVKVDAAVPDPRVHRVGGVWACEWVSYPTTAHVRRSDTTKPAIVRFTRPEFLPPPPYPQYTG
ncbi:hypothetical protein IU438_08155 [Nocardia cyriacigeorgica]|uniref:hypothetical protein n=1 Tax=Nocardia cyriacigeorgica TaxID=135487 RepID=UPI00189419A2|nr:hypothetical protein [Nocardia cyriacigeorgica]MBF6081208.1 hypothetical protein [Nocardia cyriacigeorgica]MBF6089447.1 hypothetical protein [Nocardia cyriacigeorgica]MBF6094597.1 hypothetical protein [Nocardia cyriacigeorgica]MBF6101759.1 hypothetical protein [Nocardia cyriacigeorgica]MBF6158846.1 hypothetical protein [Nocardia cyriacigeorgica]